ncbi:hypothetical protein, partial [Xenorhabdus bovienii]|uniref:hypothetical protein n=1 Tax=Xenorhabdus bovienii TaxID=40576 RepID=UPI0023B2FEFD
RDDHIIGQETDPVSGRHGPVFILGRFNPALPVGRGNRRCPDIPPELAPRVGRTPRAFPACGIIVRGGFNAIDVHPLRDIPRLITGLG